MKTAVCCAALAAWAASSAGNVAAQEPEDPHAERMRLGQRVAAVAAQGAR
jgi:hypothetical protein